MNKIKLGILNSSPILTSYGGVGPFIKNLDPFLSKDLEVTYITLPPHLHDIKYFPRRLTYFTFLLSRFKSLGKYDIVLSHVPEASYIASYSKTPLAHIFHGNHNPMSQSRFWYGKYFINIFKTFEKRIIKKAKLKYTVGNERPNIPKIMNPIYHNVAVKPKETRFGFIFVGRLEKIKNIDRIIKLYSILPEEIRKDNKLYIAGKGSQDQYLKQLADKLKITENVIFTGEIINDQLIELVSHKKMLLMASSQEGLPMAIAESLSVGIPVISTDTGDISRVIKDNYNGFLLPIEFDDNVYVEKVKTVLNNYDFYTANALESSEIFKAENVARSLVNDIQKALN